MFLKNTSLMEVSRYEILSKFIMNIKQLCHVHEIFSRGTSLVGVLEPSDKGIEMLKELPEDIELIFTNICFKGWICVSKTNYGSLNIKEIVEISLETNVKKLDKNTKIVSKAKEDE